MEMMHGLAAVVSGVDDDAIALGQLLPGDGGSSADEVAEDGLRSMGGSGEVLTRDDEQVGWGFGVDVGEDDALVILKDVLHGDFAGGDFAEDAVGHGGIVLGSGCGLSRLYALFKKGRSKFLRFATQ